MPFELTSDQDLIRKTIAEFVEAELKGKPAETLDHQRAFPSDVVKKAAGLGLFGMLVPAEQGGPGTDTVSYCLALEEFARGSGSVAAILNNLNALGSFPVAKFGSDALKAKFLPGMLAGETLTAWALTEPHAGSDVAALLTRAERDGEEYVLTGLKSFVVAAPEADVFIVFAKVSGGDGITAFLVPADSPGLRVAPAERSMTLRSADLAQVFLRGVRVPAENRLGDEGDGMRVALAALDASRLGIAAVAVGLMAESIDESRGFANQRVQFRQPIKEFQGIQWKVAEMDVKVRASRLLTWYAADRRDRGEDYATDAAAAKLHAAEVAKEVTQEGIRIHGGTGFMRDLPLERLNRDARAMSVYGGTSELQRSQLAAKLLDL